MYLKHPATFHKAVLDWYEAHGRKQLPWQTDPSPYRVWVSEVMLQQTQVATVIPYYQRWMQRFPDIDALAQSTEDEVMAVWQGLGYYSRARNLRKGAQFLVAYNNGKFPTELEGLRSIPGIGPYTAGAIMAFAYDQPAAVVDGNIKRLFCRLFGVDGPPNQSAVNRQLWAHAEALLPPAKGRDYTQGLLDLGATVCKAKTPECGRCPLQTGCYAFRQQQVSAFPTPKAKVGKPQRQGYFMWVESEGRILLEKRSRHVWTGLWCLPEIEVTPVETCPIVGTFSHTFTHYQLDATVILATPENHPGDRQWFGPHELEEIGLPTPIRRFICRHLNSLAA